MQKYPSSIFCSPNILTLPEWARTPESRASPQQNYCKIGLEGFKGLGLLLKLVFAHEQAEINSLLFKPAKRATGELGLAINHGEDRETINGLQNIDELEQSWIKTML